MHYDFGPDHDVSWHRPRAAAAAAAVLLGSDWAQAVRALPPPLPPSCSAVTGSGSPGAAASAAPPSFVNLFRPLARSSVGPLTTCAGVRRHARRRFVSARRVSQ